MSRLTSLAAAAAAVAVAAAPASAEPPLQIPLEPVPPFVIEGACPFPVQLEELENNTVQRIFSSGTEIFTGRLVLRLTNLDSGESLVLNVSGPGFFRVRNGVATFVLGGRGFFIGNAEMIDPLDPQATLNSGRIVLSSDAETGEFLGAEFIGNSTDICAALA